MPQTFVLMNHLCVKVHSIELYSNNGFLTYMCSVTSVLVISDVTKCARE